MAMRPLRTTKDHERSNTGTPARGRSGTPNAHILSVGVSPELVGQVASGLAPAHIQPSEPQSALSELGRDRYSLLLIDAKSELPGVRLAHHVRHAPRFRGLPVIYQMERSTDGAETLERWIRGLGIEPVAYGNDLTPVIAAARPVLGLEAKERTPLEPPSGTARRNRRGWRKLSGLLLVLAPKSSGR
jgi:hypothetical protein